MSEVNEVFPDLAFDLEQYAAEIELQRTTPSYQDLMQVQWPEYQGFLSNVRENLRGPREEGRANLIIIGTGGTFQLAKTDHGYAPEGSLRESFDALNLPKDETVHLELVDLMNLDSSQMTAQDHWRFLAEAVVSLEKEVGDLYDGIIVTHGTDTMARGASYLSFMLQGFPKSIVFTGSQYPARVTGSDAKDQMERAIITSKLAANPNRKITEVMVATGVKISRGTWAAKKGDTTTNAFEPWNQPNQDYDATEWARAAANGSLDRLAPALLDFGTGKNTASLEFAHHALDLRHKSPYRPFTEITNPAGIIPARMTDISPRKLARFIRDNRTTVLTQLGSATADNALVEVALKAADHGKIIVLEAPFADSKIEAGTYAAGAGVLSVIPYVKRPIPIINTSPDAFAAKINYLLHARDIEPHALAVEGLGKVFNSDDIRDFYDAMETNLVGELV